MSTTHADTRAGAEPLITTALRAQVIQLGHTIEPGQTANGGVGPYSHALNGRLGWELSQVPGQAAEISGVSDLITIGCHTGTHMDSLAHVSYNGKLFDGSDITADGVQDPFRGVVMKGMENFRPLVARGVLLDFTRFLDVERVPQDYVVTVAEMAACAEKQEVSFGAGDVVLFRMGYDRVYRDPVEYLRMPIPGPGPDAARELVRRGVVATGSDTMPYEAAPGDEPMVVHAELIPKAGVFIFEMLDLRELAELAPAEFLFLALPLRIAGGTGSPINPVALVG